MRIVKKVFIFSLITVFSIVCLTQVLLNNDAIKNKISKIHEIESLYVYSENRISSGYIEIQISSPSDNLYLLQNGEKIAILNKSTVKIDIFDNSVLEVDGKNIDTQTNIEVTKISKNINAFYDKNIVVKSNIVILGRFFVK